MILFSVGPGPGALRAPEAVGLLAEAGYEVEVYVESGAREFVGPASFSARGAAGVTLESEGSGESEEHREAPGNPEALIFAPAGAAGISRLAHGLGETPPLRRYAAGARYPCPVMVVPELDPFTAAHPAVKENLALLEEDGCVILGAPETGDSVIGYPAARDVVARVLHEIGGPLDGLHVVVTAGGTREPVDSVRFIGNRSSGKMGAAVAREAYRRGARVSVVAANVPEIEPGVDWHPVETFRELQTETLRLCGDADALVMAAAVSDFTPASPLPDEKIRRGGRETMTLELSATPDILAGVRDKYPELPVAAFAATHGDPRPDAREKLAKKGVNLVVGNDISAPGIGFGSEDNEAYIVMESVSEGGHEELFVPRGPKKELASVILGHLTPAIKHREV